VVYIIALLVVALGWLLNVIGILPTYGPSIRIGELDIGFYAIHAALAGSVAFAVWMLRRGFGETRAWAVWVGRTRTRRGNAVYVDWLVLVLGLGLALRAFASGTLTPYMMCCAFLAVAAATHSLAVEEHDSGVDNA
jgi:hypothetical protein